MNLPRGSRPVVFMSRAGFRELLLQIGDPLSPDGFIGFIGGGAVARGFAGFIGEWAVASGVRTPSLSIWSLSGVASADGRAEG